MFKIANNEASGFFEKVSTLLKAVAAFFVSIGTVVGFLGRFLGDALKRSTEKPGLAAFAARIAIKLAMYLAGAAVPLALWVAYLYLSFWGIQNCEEFHVLRVVPPRLVGGPCGLGAIHRRTHSFLLFRGWGRIGPH